MDGNLKVAFVAGNNMARKLTKEQAAAMGRKGGGHNKGKIEASTIAKLTARDELRKGIEAMFPELLIAWKDSALGHYIQVKTAEGETKVYKKAPNPVAIKDMVERVLGKPVQPVEAEIMIVPQLTGRAQSVLDELNNIINADQSGHDDSGVDAEGDGN